MTVTLGPEPWLATCNVCGEHVDMPPLPMDLKIFADYLKLAARLHKKCK